ncbi:MAG: hypothetical protein ACFFCM_10055 [Promethearchaeota archaeon]
MLHNVFILTRSSGLTLFDHQIKPINGDKMLIGGLLSAVQMFCREIHIGELTTFRTNRFQIIISVRNYVIVALFLDKKDEEDFWQFRAFEIGYRFENEYSKDLKTFKGKTNVFENFNSILDEILDKKEDSEFFGILKWLKKTQDGDLHICSSDPIDIAFDLGPKQHFHSINKIIFVKIYDREVTQQELQLLLDSCKSLGFKQIGYKIDSVFPTKLIVFGKSFEKKLLKNLDTKLLEHKNKHFFISNKLDDNIKKNSDLSNIFNCYLELWQWNPEAPFLIYS